MAKNKTAGAKINGAAQTAENQFKNGVEALKTGFDKAVKNYDHFLGYGKETVEAYVKAANAAGKGAETNNAEIYPNSKQLDRRVHRGDEGRSRLQVRSRGD